MTICHGSDLSNHHAINYTYRLIDTLVGITKGTFVGVSSFLFCSFQKYAIRKTENIDQIIEIDMWAKLKTLKYIERINV